MAPLTSIDHTIGALAATQGGHITRSQLHRLGLTRDAIVHRVRRGLLIRVFRGVYAAGHTPTHPHDRARGALLASGPCSALTHDSAASYYGMWKEWRFPLHVIVPTDRRLSGLVIHRKRRLVRADIAAPEPGLRVTRPAITLLDIAPRLRPKRLRRLTNEIRLQYGIELEDLQALAARFPRHPGVRHLRPILETAQVEPTRSDWEDEWPAYATAHGLPPYRMNETVCGHRVDVLFMAERLIVELDGWSTHKTRESFIRDREQDAEILERMGIPTVRITYETFHSRGAQQAARLHVILQRRRQE